MILKSMGVKTDKDELDSSSQEVDEDATGKFNFSQFCSVSFFGENCVTEISTLCL